MEDKLRIPATEAARRLNTTPRTIRRWFDAGHLAGELIGGRLWIDVPFRRGVVRVKTEPTLPSVTAAEAARRLGTSRASIHRMFSNAQVDGEWVNGHLRIAESSVAARERLAGSRS